MEQKQTLIILEGHDMAGKTAIGNALSTMLSIPLIKIEKPKSHDHLVELLYGTENICQLAQQTGYSFIYDRLHPSEYVYSRVFNRVTAHEQLIKLDARFAEMGALIVICYKDEEKFQFDPEDQIALAKYKEIISWYNEFVKMTACKVLMLNTSDENLEAQLEAIKTALHEGTDSR